MEDKTYKVILADGTVIDNLKLNGNNFISSTPIDGDVFVDNCSPVTIDDGEKQEIHENMTLVQLMKYGTEDWFILRDLTSDELEKIQMQADIEYLAMMAGVTL